MTHLASPRESAWQRGSTLSRSLHNFYRLQYLMVVLALLFGVAALGAGLGVSGSSYAPVLFWLGALGILLMVAVWAVYLRAVRSAAEAVGTVADYAGGGRQLNIAQVQHFVTWLGIWQWVTVVGAAVSILPMLAGSFLTPLLASLDKGSQTSGLLGLMTGVSSLALSLPSVILTWLILAAIKNFFLATVQRASGQQIAIGPAADAAAGWLTFSLIMMVISALLSIPGYIGLAAALVVPNFLGHHSAVPTGLALLCCLPIALLAALQIWQIVLVARSGGFSRDVAAALDGQNFMGQNRDDPWAGALLEDE